MSTDLMYLSRRIVSLAFWLACICAGGATLTAQSAATAGLTIVVLDSSDGRIASADVGVSEVMTGVTRAGQTGTDGSYALPLLPPGRYVVRVERAGFRSIASEEITLEVAEQRRVEITLPVGDLSDAVTVAASASQTTGSDVSFVVDERQVKELPLNGKNFLKLASLTPGVGDYTSNPIFSGARKTTNTYMLDGVNSTDQRGTRGLAVSGGAALFSDASPNLVSTEAIREFRVISSNADATFGHGSGGQISIVTKSGTNDLNGSAYYLHRNDALDARSFFNHGPFFDDDGRAKVPPFKQHQYGATAGGPLKANGHFYFASVEGFRHRLQQTSASTIVPNAALIGLIPGDLGRFYRTYYIDRGVVPASGHPDGEFQPVYTSEAERQQFLAAGFSVAAFDGDLANGEAGAVRLSSARREDIDQTNGLIRSDHRLTDRVSLNVRYAFARSERLNDSPGIPQSNFFVPLRWHHPVAQANWAIGSSQYVEARVGVLRSEYSEGSASAVDSRLLDIGVSQHGLSIVSGGTPFAQLNVNPPKNFYDYQTVPEVSLLHVWTGGRLTLRSGMQWRKSFFSMFSGGGQSPLYSFTGYLGPHGLLGERAGQAEVTAASLSLSYFGAGGGVDTPLRRYRQAEQEYFSQADVRLTPRVTLNLGLRYSYYGVLSEADGILSNLYAVDPNGQVVPDVSPFHFGRTANRVELVGEGLPFFRPDRNNFQPRVGVAWDLAGDARSIVRASYGLYTDRLVQLMVASAPSSTPFSLSGSADSVPFRLAGLPELDQTTNVGIYGIDPTIRNPTTHRYQVTLEQAIAPATTVAVSYVGASGRGLTWSPRWNGAFGVPQELRPDPRFSFVEIAGDEAESQYHALQVLGRKRWSRGFAFTATYTYAHSRDDVTQDQFGTPPAVINLGGSPEPGFQGGGPGGWIDRPLSANRGYADFDLRHNLAFSGVWDLPFGGGRRFLSGSGVWGKVLGGLSLSGVAVLRSGLPVDLRYSGDLADVGYFSVRPVLVSGSLDDIYARGAASRTQYLIPVTEARARLANINVTDPSSWVERNALRGPAVYTLDLSLNKRIPLPSGTELSVQVNAFNVLNRANLGSPNNDLASPFFGQISSLAPGMTPRQLQIGVRLQF